MMQIRRNNKSTRIDKSPRINKERLDASPIKNNNVIFTRKQHKNGIDIDAPSFAKASSHLPNFLNMAGYGEGNLERDSDNDVTQNISTNDIAFLKMDKSEDNVSDQGDLVNFESARRKYQERDQSDSLERDMSHSPISKDKKNKKIKKNNEYLSTSFIMPSSSDFSGQRKRNDYDLKGSQNFVTSRNHFDNEMDMTMAGLGDGLLTDAKGRNLQIASDEEDNFFGNNKKYRAHSPFEAKRNSHSYNYNRVVGLENRALDCFMNASLQCIFWVPEFMEFFITKTYLDHLLKRKNSFIGERKSEKDMKLAGHRFWDAVHQVCYKVICEDSTVIKANSLRLQIKGEFWKSKQHDANEFLLYLFDKLQDEQIPKNVKFDSFKYTNPIDAWEGYYAQHNSIIDQLFIGMTCTNVTCERCKNVTKKYETFSNILVSWKVPTLKGSYKEFLSEETLTEDNQYKWEKCQRKVRCSITKEMVKLPKYTIFLLKRFDFIKQRKINDAVKYKSTIKLSDKFAKNMKYNLNGLVIHSGGLSGGHYTAVGKKLEKWIYFNDSSVKEISKKVALKKSPYILFYVRE